VAGHPAAPVWHDLESGVVLYNRRRCGGRCSDQCLRSGRSRLRERSQDAWGWTVGASIEYALSQNWSLKGEYLYVNFGNTSYFNPPPGVFADRVARVP